MEKIRIGLFCDSFYPLVDGVVKVVENYAKLLQEDGCQVTVFVPRPRDKKYVDNFPFKVVRCKILRVMFLDYDLSLPAFDRKFRKAIKDADLDLIHVHSPFTIGKTALKYAKKHKIPSIITFHSQYKLDFQRAAKIKPIVWMLMKSIMRTFNMADQCFTMNNFAKDLVIEYGCKKPISLVPNATDFEANKSREEYRAIANKEWNLKQDEFVLLYLGRLNKLKNVDFIVSALSKLPPNMPFKMIFSGFGQDRGALEKEVAHLGLSDKVMFTGLLTDEELKKACFARGDVFLLPSKYDTDAITKQEAAFFSNPTVCIEGTGAGSVIKHNVNGFLIKDDEQALADLIVYLSKHREVISRVGQQAKKDLYVPWPKAVAILKQQYAQILRKQCKKNNKIALFLQRNTTNS